MSFIAIHPVCARFIIRCKRKLSTCRHHSRQVQVAIRALFGVDETSVLEIVPAVGVRVTRRMPTGPSETEASVRVRHGQEYFRDAVINNFGGKCGITGLAIRELLIASHILPWGTHADQRLNTRNGLALSRLHDAAFDRGLIAFDDSLRLILSARLQREAPQRTVNENFLAYAGQALLIPEHGVPPDVGFLAKHRVEVFLGA